MATPERKVVTTCLRSVAPKLATTGFAQNKNAHRALHLYVLTASGLSSVRRTTATSDPANRFPNWPLTSLAE
jgi:hypothetical protein